MAWLYLREHIDGLWLHLVHLHREGEAATLVYAFRRHCDSATARLCYLLDDREAEPDALTVHLGRSVKLTESSEKLVKVLFCDAFARVDDLDLQLRLLGRVASKHTDRASWSEF